MSGRVPPSPTIRQLGVFETLTFLIAFFAFEFTRLHGTIALLWPTNAPLLAALCTLPAKRWAPYLIAYTVGVMPAIALSTPMAPVTPIWAGINIGETILATMMLRWWRIERWMFDSPRGVAIFVAVAAVSPLAGGVISAPLAHWLTGKDMGQLFLDWWLAHGLGLMIVTPLAMLFARREFNARTLGKPWRAIGITLLIAAASGAVFGQSEFPLLFVTILPLLIATFEFRRVGAAFGIVIVAAVGGFATARGYGPLMLIHGDEGVRLQVFDLFLAVSFLATLPVAAVLAQRDRLLGRLEDSEARYRLLAENSTDIMLTLAPDGTIRYASAAARELGGLDPAELVGRNAVELVHKPDVERVVATHRAALAAPDRQHSVEYRARKADGTLHWFETNTRAVRDEHGDVVAVVSVIRNLDDRKHREDALVQAATTDPLTGLLNRAAFNDAAQIALGKAAQGRPATIALLDLDHFKRVNDTYGHAAGDQALLMLADLLRENIRGGDFVGRIGGEEFAILFNGATPAATIPVCERLCAKLAARDLKLDNATIHLTMSIGVSALMPLAGIDTAFKTADAALYAAKANGRNRVEPALELAA